MNYHIREMTHRDYDAAVALWHSVSGIGLDDNCDSRRGIARYLKRNPRLSFVACLANEIIGAVLSGHDGRRGYLHHLAVAAPHSGRPRTRWGLSQFSSDENGTVPLAKVDVITGRPHRKQGVGKALVGRCLRALARQHIPKCKVFLFRSNSEGRSFWRHNAWNLRRDLSVLQRETSK